MFNSGTLSAFYPTVQNLKALGISMADVADCSSSFVSLLTSLTEPCQQTRCVHAKRQHFSDETESVDMQMRTAVEL